ncbi:MAG: hypothetical protein ACK4GL_05050 [Flavobacteriales bacterium]
MKKLLTILSISFLHLYSFAQKGVDFVDGWLEFKKGDTIRGKVCYINTVTGERYDKVFHLNEAGSKKRYGSDKINSLMADGKIYEFVTIEGSGLGPLLMQRVIAGDIYMYRAWFKTPDSSPTKLKYEETIFLRKKGSDDFVEVVPKNFFKQMKSYFKGDEDIVQMIKENNYEIKDLEKIVQAYNDKD